MYNVDYNALLISLFKLFHTINHNLLMLFSRSILVPCLQHHPETNTGNIAPAETTSEAYWLDIAIILENHARYIIIDVLM